MSSFFVSTVTTYEKGTVVSMYSPRTVWFYDRNDSGTLDTGDLKLNYDRDADLHLREEPVSKADIDEYGKRVSHLFKKARDERAQMASLARKFRDAPQKSIAALGVKSSELPEKLHGLLINYDMREDIEGGKHICTITKGAEIRFVLTGQIYFAPDLQEFLGLTNGVDMIDAAFHSFSNKTRIGTSIIEGCLSYVCPSFYEDYMRIHIDLIPA